LIYSALVLFAVKRELPFVLFAVAPAAVPDFGSAGPVALTVRDPQLTIHFNKWTTFKS